MLVEELIEKLKEFDQEKEVVWLSSGDNPLDGGYPIGSVFEIKGTLVDAVFLEEG